MKRIVCYAIGLVFAATHAFAGVVPAPKPFYAGEEQTDARMIYVGGSGSGGRLAVDNHAEFMLARDDSNVALNWCNLGTFKWTFGFFSFDGPISEYPSFNSNLNGSTAVTFDGGDKLRMILEPGQGHTLPSEITDGVLSVELWVVNPSVETGEILIRFEDSPNLDLTVDNFSMSGSTSWQHLVAVSNGTETSYYLNGSHVTTQGGAINFSGNAVINLGAQSFTGSLAALRIHTEPMNAADVSHNHKGGVNLGTYLFYAINANYQSSSVDVHGDPNITTGDPTACSELMWRESAHFRSMWVDDPEDPDMATRVKTKQLPDAEKFYAFFNEKTGKHLPHVSNHERLRGDGRKYKWLVGNGSGNYSGWSDALGLGYGVSYRGYASFHEYCHGTDNHQMGAMTDQWWEIHANFTPSWAGADNGVNPAEAKPKGAHAYPAYGGNYYHDYLIFDHFVDTPEFGGLFVTRLWNRPPRKEGVDRDYPPQTMEDCDPSPETPFNEEWVKCAAKNITWDYPRNPDYARHWSRTKYKGHLHFTLLEPVPYLSAGWYEPQKWRAPQQHGYNICALEPNEGTVTADLTGFVEASRGSAWSAMFVAVDDGTPRYGSVFTDGEQGSFNVQSGDDELYLVVVATPTNIMECGIFGHEHQDNTDYRGANKARFPYQVLLGGTTPKPDIWHPTPGIDPSATVDGTAYVSPNASVGPNAKILGNARVEDYATVNGTVRDNAVVSDYAVVEANAIIRDNARVTDFARIWENTIVENSAHVMEHARITEGAGHISDYAVIKGSALVDGPIHGTAIIDGNYIKDGEHDKGYWFLWSWGDYLVQGEVDKEFNQLYLEYQFEVDNGYRVWDTHGATWGRLVNGPTYVSDNGGTALELDGQDDFVDLHQSVGQFEQVSFDVDVKWDGGANGQKLINFSNSTTGDEAWLSPSDSQGKLAFSITVGGSTQVVRASNPLPSGSWKNVKLITYNDKFIIHVDDTEWASSSSITHDIDEISANECYIGRGASGDNFAGRIDDFTVWTKALVEDLPPYPNPSQWLVEPMVLDANNVMMQAVLAVDGSPPVEYYFEETSGNPGGSDSGWVTSKIYYDQGLNPSTQYAYRVRARDGQGNTTAYSTSKNVTTPATNPGYFIQDADGTVSIEAENYDHLVTGTVTGQIWSFYNGVSGYTGSGTMRVPDKGEAMGVQYAPDRGPRMDFNVKFNRTGTHYMHVRGHGANPNGDSCHGGLDMQEVDTLKTIASFPTGANEYGWLGDYTFDVPYPGIHKVNIWMREDDTMIDKIVITDKSGVPSGSGPAESSRGGDPAGTQTDTQNASVRVDSNDNVYLENLHMSMAFSKGSVGYNEAVIWAFDGNSWRQMAVSRPIGKISYRANAGSAVETVIIPTQYEILNPSGAVARVRFTSQLVDDDNVTWSFAYTFELEADKSNIKTNYQASANNNRQLLYFQGPDLYAGEGSFGSSKDLAIFPGLEYLEAEEQSSSTRDMANFVTLLHNNAVGNRYVPHPHKITMPLMGLEQNNGLIGLMWDPLQKWGGDYTRPAARFASPNYIEEQENHLMGLFLPSVPDFVPENDDAASSPYPLTANSQVTLEAYIVAQAPGEVLDMLDQYYAIFGMPEKIDDMSITYEEALEWGRVGYMETIYDPVTNGIRLWEQSPAYPAPGAIATLFRLSLDITDPAKKKLIRDRIDVMVNRALSNEGIRGLTDWLDGRHFPFDTKFPAGCLLRTHMLPFYIGYLEDGIAAWKTRVYEELINTQRLDGTWEYAGDPQIRVRQGDDIVSGTIAELVGGLLKYARITGNKEAFDAGMKGLEVMNSFIVPRGQNTWEVPKYTPDIQAAGLSVWGNLEAYEITGDQKYIEKAKYWAKTGVPFIYHWEQPGLNVMKYSTIPVYGASWYDYIDWFARPVQWCGLPLGYYMIKLAEYDQSFPWKILGEGIMDGAIQQMLFVVNEKPGLYADWIQFVGPYISGGSAWEPEGYMKPIFLMQGQGVEVDTKVLHSGDRRVHVSTGAVLKSAELVKTDRGVSFELEYPAGETSYAVVAGLGSGIEVKKNGRVLARTDDLEAADEGWKVSADGLLLLKIKHDKLAVRIDVAR